MTGPKEIYHAKIAAKELSQDSGQAVVIGALDALYHKLMAARESQASRSFLSGLFSKKTDAPIHGLYLYGGVGRGKSLLMDMFFACLPEGVGKRVHFHDFMVLAHDKMNEARQIGADDPVAVGAKALARHVQVLCFDEMEVRDIADAMILKRLFDGLFAQGVVVVATSNRHPDELYKNGLHRDRFMPFIDQLKTRCDIQEIAQGNDWRSRLLGKEPRWYVGNKTLIEAQFMAVTDGASQDALMIKVAGRELVFARVSQNIAYVSFDALCAVPLAARDYVAIADRLTGIFMTDIPALGDAAQNEARRFMWLIDALYDRGRFIVASADCDMADLYQGRQWAFEFDRTLSRLSEMTRLS